MSGFPLVYELNTRCWLNQLSDQQHTQIHLASVPESQFESWQDSGFTHLWLMGVWTTGPRSRAEALALRDSYTNDLGPCHALSESDIAGSPYSIAEYRVPEALGGEDGLRVFRQRLRGHGIQLLLDFVPNHVGLDHPWLAERPGLFVQSPRQVPGTFAQTTGRGTVWLAHGKDPYFAPWTDTAQLDYRQPETRIALRQQLLEIASRCDGVRCDMAMLVLSDVFEKTWQALPPVPVDLPPSGDSRSLPASTVACEFWQEAIAATQQAHPDFLFLAEAYWGLEARLQSLGFDYTYDKDLYDGLIHHDPFRVQEHLVNASAPFIASGAHFLENHDEARVASILLPAEHRAAALLILALPGMRFLHEGQLTGARLKVPVQLSRRCPEEDDPPIRAMYEQILKVLQMSAVGQGEWKILKPREAWSGNPTHRNFVLVQWRDTEPGLDLAVVNLASHRGQCFAPLAVQNLGHHEWSMKDWLGEEAFQRRGADLQSQGLYLDLPGHGAQLFHFKPLT